MGRPPTPVGSYGAIKTRDVSYVRNGKKVPRFEARTLFRMGDGSVKDVSRTGNSRTNAEHRLKEHLTELAEEVRGGEISKDTRMWRIAALWLDELDRQAKQGTLAAGTARNYRSHWDNWIKPRIGELQAREVRAMTCEKTIQNAHDKQSFATAKGVRAALRSLCAFCVRYGAMDRHPAKDTSRLVNTDPKEIRAMTLEERLELARELTKFAEKRQVDKRGRKLGRRAAVWLSLPDVYEAMLSTGVRLGELLAIMPENVDTTEKTVTITHHVVWVKGTGLVRQQLRKGREEGIVLRVPLWSLPMWRRRKIASGEGPLFPGYRGGLLDPSNTIHRIREAFNECGFAWVTSHVFRKTVATIMDDAGLPTSAIADQLGNDVNTVLKHYRAKRVVNEQGAEVLEGMFGEDRDTG